MEIMLNLDHLTQNKYIYFNIFILIYKIKNTN